MAESVTVETQLLQPKSSENGYSEYPHATPDKETYTVSFFRCLNQPRGRQDTIDWPQLCELLSTCDIRPEKDGALISGAIYDPEKVHRAKANVRAVSILCADFDETHTQAQLSEIIEAADVRAILYPTHSHGTPDTKNHPNASAPGQRFRAVFPLDEPIPVEEYPDAWERFNRLFGGEIDAACKDASRAFYLPSHPTGADVEPLVFEGCALRVADLPTMPAAMLAPKYHPTDTDTGTGKPGDDYNAKVSNEDTTRILEAHGHTVTRSSSNRWKVKRAGKKTPGISATIGHYGPGQLHVFSSAMPPFEANKDYQAWRVFALLEHNGDFKAAARDLAQQGYGETKREYSQTTRKVDAPENASTREECQGKPAKKSQADVLIEIGLAGELFRTPNDEAHSTFERNGHLETHRLKSAGYRDYLKSQHFKITGKAPSSQATQDALDTLAGFAYESGKRHETHLRIAATRSEAGEVNALYMDLGDDAWRVVEINAHGWQIIKRAPVKFIRPRGMLPLPEPRRGGDINELRQYINIGGEQDFCLFVAWELAAFQPAGALPILMINGAQGSAKTSTQRAARQLLDPNATPTRAMPRNARDLMIAAKNSATASFDNVSAVEDWLSDAMCSLATGAGFATRELHSDGEETLITAKRRAMLNGITGTGSRADFLDRCIVLTLPRITEKQRRVESEIDAGFARAHGAILGVILDAISVGICKLPHTRLEKLPRMADFATWVTACETGLGWKQGTFLNAYSSNLKEGVEIAADASPIVAALRSFIAKNGAFEGLTSTLSEAINKHVGEETSKHKDFPSSSRALGHAIRRVVTVLESVGIEVIEKKKNNQGQPWVISPISVASPKSDDVGDDVSDDVPKSDDVDVTSSLTSSLNEALSHTGAFPESMKSDESDDVQQHLSFPVSPSHIMNKKREIEKEVIKDNDCFTSSLSSLSSLSSENDENVIEMTL